MTWIIRLFNKIYARLFGYFWKPCPICGECFGGHEKGMGNLIYELVDIEHPFVRFVTRGHRTCKTCAVEAQRRNEAVYKVKDT
jgi:hypothetical protein